MNRRGFLLGSVAALVVTPASSQQAALPNWPPDRELFFRAVDNFMQWRGLTFDSMMTPDVEELLADWCRWTREHVMVLDGRRYLVNPDFVREDGFIDWARLGERQRLTGCAVLARLA